MPEKLFNRRDFIRIGGIGIISWSSGFIATQLKEPIADYISEDGSEVVIGRDEEGLYAKFKGNEFRFKRMDLNGRGLDYVLYELNNEKNPNLKIKGVPIAILRNIFGTLNYEDGIQDIRLGEQRRYSHQLWGVPKSKGIYYFPYYIGKN